MRKQKAFLVEKASGMNQAARWLVKQFPFKHRRRSVVLALSGDLGAGKTTFVKALGRAYGIRALPVSPSFVLWRSYQGKKVLIHHLDAWRINYQDMLQLGFKQIIKDPHAVVCVEWADRVKRILPRHVVWLHFEHLSLRQRKVTVKFLL